MTKQLVRYGFLVAHRACAVAYIAIVAWAAWCVWEALR